MASATLELDARITELRAAVSEAQDTLAQHQASLDRWLRAQSVDEANQASWATMQNTARKVAEFRALVADWTERLEALQKDLDGRLKFREAVEQAALAAIAKGVSPEQAYELATAQVMDAQTRRKVLNIALWVGVAVAVVLVLANWKRIFGAFR